MLWWVQALPLIIICRQLLLPLLVYDFVLTLIHGENGDGR